MVEEPDHNHLRRSLMERKAEAKRHLKIIEVNARTRLGLHTGTRTVQAPFKQNSARPGKLSLGTTADGNLLFIDPKARTMHMHVCGGTGKGKSTLFEHMIRQDIRHGHGLCLIDPHGGHENNLYNNIIRWLDQSGQSKDRKIHLIDPNDTEYTTGFNPLRIRPGMDISVVTGAALQAVQAAWGDEDTLDKPRLRRVITATFTLLAEHNLSFAEADLLFDVKAGDRIRKTLSSSLKDRYARTVWQDLISMKPDDFREYIEGPLNRLAEFVRSDAVRRMIGQTERTIDFREVMNNGDIVLVNLQSGDIAADEATNLLGTLIVRDLFEQCRKRDNLHEPFFLYVDECHRYLSGDIPKILDEARKNGLHAILAHQRLGQLHSAGRDIYSAVMGSTEIKMVVGGLFMDEAKVMTEELIELELERPVDALISPTVVGYKTIDLHNISKTEGSSSGDSVSNTEAAAVAHSTSSGSGRGTSDGLSMGQALSIGPDGNPGFDTASSGQMNAESSSSFSSESESHAASRAKTVGKNAQTNQSTTVGQSESREAVLEDRPGAVHGLDKILYSAARWLKNLSLGEAVVSIGGVTIKVETPDIQQRKTTRSLREIKSEIFAKCPSSLPISQAQKNVEDRELQVMRLAAKRDDLRKKAWNDEGNNSDNWE